jgi:Protein of unknown function (DUF2283)
MIQTSYDPKADVLHIKFGPDGAKYDGADEVAPSVFVEFDPDCNAIGVEGPERPFPCGQQMRHPAKAPAE